MSLTKVALVLSCGTAAAHFDFKAKQFAPLVDACDGVELQQNCTASFSGVCSTAEDGERFCSLGHHEHGHHGHHEHDHHGHHEHGHHGHHEDEHGHHHEHHGVMGMLHKLKHGVMSKLGFHCGHHGKHHGKKHHDWPRHLGDCAAKADGESCSFPRLGRCIPSGKCPVFQGKTVCKPWDSHPPQFVTQACSGKQAGDTCWRSIAPGTCTKLKYEEQLVCKTGLAAWLAPPSRDTEGAAAEAGSQAAASEIVV